VKDAPMQESNFCATIIRETGYNVLFEINAETTYKV